MEIRVKKVVIILGLLCIITLLAACDPPKPEVSDASITPAVTTQPPVINCEVAHSGQFWQTYGTTDLPVGTVFTFELTSDGKTTDYELAAKEGDIIVKGVHYGEEYGKTATIFGFDSVSMPHTDGVNVSAVVKYDDTVVC